ncbi:uncharacterized protein LOC124264621 [Haliotis rubra]|uniref:uncharacterized protein LOC124264621 n=1 Tax=Haliotis rubra TaxID=36100 RepID=UPI001EE52ABC|nr:uncharacterized protein LOC124264621 [Haliotis rubra]
MNFVYVIIFSELPVCAMTHHVTDPGTAERVLLGVNIKGYYCSELAQVNMSTGDNVTEYPNETVTNITDKTVRIDVNTTDASIGTELTFTCGDQRWNMSCNQDNSEVLEDKATSNKTSMVAIVGVVAGIVIVTVIITLVVFLVKMKKLKREEQPDNHVFDSPDDVTRETNDTSGHEYNALYLTALERDILL